MAMMYTPLSIEYHQKKNFKDYQIMEYHMVFFHRFSSNNMIRETTIDNKY